MLRKTNLLTPWLEPPLRPGHRLSVMLNGKLVSSLADDLKQLRILPIGNRLEQGATDIDLNNLNLGEFKARGDMQVGQNTWLVAKKGVPYELWNRLLGIETPERLQTPE